MMSTNNYSGISPSSFSARQQNTQFSPYVSPSLRQQGQRFNYAPSPYPRPRSSASKPNPAISGDNTNYHLNVDNIDGPSDYYYRSELLFSNNNNNHSNYGTGENDMNDRFKNSLQSVEYSSPRSEYFSCNDESFSSPMSSVSGRVSYPTSGYMEKSEKQFSSFYDGFQDGGNMLLGNYQKQTYPQTPVNPQQNRRGFGQRKFARGRGNGFAGALKRGASSGFPYQGNSGGMDGPLGKQGVKRPRVQVRCYICNIDFTSDIPYQMHLAGAKHAKKIKANDTLKSMEAQAVPKPVVHSNSGDGSYFYCEHCQVVTNSSQQLAMHCDGTKHKNKVKKLSEGVTTTAVAKPQIKIAPKEIGDNPKSAKIAKFSCDVCDLILNSKLQMMQHLISKKHQAKVKGEPLPIKKKPRKFTDQPTNGDESSASAAPTAIATAVAAAAVNNITTPGSATAQALGVHGLGSSFVKGGILK